MGKFLKISKEKQSTCKKTKASRADAGDTIPWKKEELLKVLSSVRPGLGSSDALAFMEDFVFTKDRVSTYNGMICISFPFKSGLGFSVNSRKFYELVNRVKDDLKVRIVKEGEASILHMFSGRTRAGFNISELTDDMTFLNFVGEDAEWQALPEDFLEASKLCLFCVSRDEAHEELTSLCVRGDLVLSSDNYRISRYRMKASVEGEFLLFRTAVRELLKFQPVEFFSDGNWIHFRTGDGIVFSIRLVMGEYPDLSAYLDGIDGEILALPDGTEASLNRVGVMAEEDEDVDEIVFVQFGDGKMLCRGERRGFGWVEDEQDCIYEGDKISFFTNPDFLKEMVSRSSEMTVDNGRCKFSFDRFDHVIVLSTGD